jgi:Ni/Co efflux regulator RcnB
MKRLILISAAIAALATSLPMAEVAIARDHDRGGQSHGDRGRGPPERRGPPEGRGPPDRRYEGPRYEGPRYERRYDDRPQPRRRDLREEYDRRDERRRYDDGPYPPPNAGPARRGGYLPDRYRGGTVDDYQRFRLRPPPRGYTWVRVNGGFALVSIGDGRIFDVIPD